MDGRHYRRPPRLDFLSVSAQDITTRAALVKLTPEMLAYVGTVAKGLDLDQAAGRALFRVRVLDLFSGTTIPAINAAYEFDHVLALDPETFK